MTRPFNDGLRRTLAALRGATDSPAEQFIRYAVAGGAAYAVDFVVLASLTEFAGLHYLLATGAGFLSGLTLTYMLSVRWVFARRSLASKGLEFGVFAIVGFVGLLMTEVLMWLFTSVAGLYYLLSKMVTGLIVLVWNFSARRVLLFSGSGFGRRKSPPGFK